MLYLRHSSHNASPKAISGRTSYLQVRLAFHLYPQVIPQFCNIGGFGPPVRVTALSPCPWVAHLVSCLIPATLRPIQTRFRFAFGCHSLKLATDINSLAHSPKGTPSGPKSLRPVVSTRFQILFHSPRWGSFHLSLTVLVRYRSSSVFRLGRWTAQVHTELACSVLLRIPRSASTSTGLSPSLADFPTSFDFDFELLRSYNPGVHVHRFGLLRFRSPLLAESSLFLGLLRCFSSPGSLRLCDLGVSSPRGFPIRTSPIVAAAHASSELFAVYHVLLRHLTPRHSPCALIRFCLWFCW